MKRIAPLVLALFIVGCASFYQSVIGITSVVDAAMKDWAALSVKGKTSPALDAHVTSAHNNYRQAAAMAQAALETYKAIGNQPQYIQALNAAKVAAQGVLDQIIPLLDPNEADKLSTNLANAKTL